MRKITTRRELATRLLAMHARKMSRPPLLSTPCFLCSQPTSRCKGTRRFPQARCRAHGALASRVASRFRRDPLICSRPFSCRTAEATQKKTKSPALDSPPTKQDDAVILSCPKKLKKHNTHKTSTWPPLLPLFSLSPPVIILHVHALRPFALVEWPHKASFLVPFPNNGGTLLQNL